MGTVKIDTTGARHASSDLFRSAGNLEAVRSSLANARKAAAPLGRVSRGLSEQMSRVNSLLSEISSNVSSLSRGVESILTSYEEAESYLVRSIVSNNQSVNTGSGGMRLGSNGSFASTALSGGIGAIASGSFLSGKIGSKSRKKFKWDADGSLFGGKARSKGESKWKISDGDAYASWKGEAEGWLAKGKVSGDFGKLHGDASGSVGKVSASGKVEASIMKDGKFDPHADISGKVEATALEGEANVRYGSDDLNAFGHAEGKVGTASAEAHAKIDKNGVSVGASAEAYAAKGSIQGGIDLGFVKLSGGVEGKIGGAGVDVGGSVTGTGVSGRIGAGLIAGAGVSFSVDWSGSAKYFEKVGKSVGGVTRGVSKFLKGVGSGATSLWRGW